MKLTIVLLIAASLHLSATGFGQKVSITGKDLTLEKIFTLIKKQTSYVFFYDYSIFQGARPVSLDLKDAEVEDVLRTCLRDQNLDFSITNQTISITKKAFKATPAPTFPGNPPEVVGTVRSDNGNPLAGATVFIRKLNKSGETNAEGEFILKDVPNGKYAVEISYIGYEKYVTEILVASYEVRIVADMRLAKNSLDEAVVKGYYTTTKRLNTGNVTTVKGEDIQKQPVTDPILALEGRVPGLYISQTSGIPGAYSTIRLRGQNSLPNSASKLSTLNDPLYIVDGVPFGSASLSNIDIPGGATGNPGNGVGQGLSPFNSLNPSDIDNIEVLKDADATAIYGSRGANGVILITTKKGKAGKTSVDANVFSGAGKVTRKLNLLNTQQYLQMRHEAFNNDGATPGYTDYDVNGDWDTSRYTNWQKTLIGNTSRFTNAQLNISGGNINTQFLIGGGYSNQSTVFPGNYIDIKASSHISLNHVSANQRFRVHFGAIYVNDNSNLPNIDLTNQIMLAPDAPALYNANGDLNWQSKNGSFTWYNPLAYTMQKSNTITNNLMSSISLSYNLFAGLEVKASLGYTHSQADQSNITPGSFYPPPYNTNSALRLNFFGTNTIQTSIIEPQIAYHKSIGKGILDVMVGSTFQENKSHSIAQGASGFTSDALITNPASASTFSLSGDHIAQYRYNALFGRIGYNWKEKYLINITGRRDGSSRFGPGKQFGNFGAIGAGWIFSKERFFQEGLPFLSFGKLRVSYGSTGNDQIKDYQYLSTYTPISSTYQGVTALSPDQLTNPNFAWERVNKMEGGLELGFLNERINFSVSYYHNRTNNQLVGYSLPSITGFGSVQANFPAVIQNTGLEFTGTSVNIKSKNFAWSSSINLTIPNNKLVSYPNIDQSPYQYTYAIGHSLFIQYLYHYAGLNNQTGVYTFATKSSNGMPISPDDLIISKPITQTYYGGFQNSINYKGFQLDILIQFVKQLGTNYFVKVSTLPGYFNNGLSNQPTYLLDRWQKAGDNTNVEKVTQGGGDGSALNAWVNIISSDYSISDASFIRLKNLSLSYQLSVTWNKKAYLQNARIYLQCQNLFTTTKYKGLDPETGGISLPPLRMITGGIQFSL